MAQPLQVGGVTLLRHAVEVTQQSKRVEQGQVPPELRLLAEDDADAPGEVAALALRVESGDAHAAAGGHEDASQHLDRRALAGAVRPDQPDHLAALDGEREVAYGMDYTHLRIDDAS